MEMATPQLLRRGGYQYSHSTGHLLLPGEAFERRFPQREPSSRHARFVTLRLVFNLHWTTSSEKGRRPPFLPSSNEGEVRQLPGLSKGGDVILTRTCGRV